MDVKDILTFIHDNCAVPKDIGQDGMRCLKECADKGYTEGFVVNVMASGRITCEIRYDMKPGVTEKGLAFLES